MANVLNKISYRAGYKYQLAEAWSYQTPIKGFDARTNHDNPWCSLSERGLLIVRAGYAWDGPSGPTIDTPDFMRGSLAHDALYQLMREGALPQTCREAADKLLRDICREDGMGAIRAWYVYQGVRRYAAYAATKREAAVMRAP